MGLLKQRFALWAIGQALPSADSLQKHVTEALLGIMLASVGGVLLALSFGAGFYLLYHVLLKQGVEVWVAISFITVLTAFFASMAFVGAKKMLKRSTTLSEDLEPFSSPTDELTDALRMLASSFIDGFLEEEDEVEKTKRAVKETVEEVLEELEIDFAESKEALSATHRH